MGYAIDWSDLEQRIQDQKAALLDTSQNMDPERLKLKPTTSARARAFSSPAPSCLKRC